MIKVLKTLFEASKGATERGPANTNTVNQDSTVHSFYSDLKIKQ